MDNGHPGGGNGKNGNDPLSDLGRISPDGRVPGEDSSDGFPGRSEVDDLIIKTLNSAASPFEDERLKRWRESAPGNEEYFQEMAKVWGLTTPEPVVPAWGPPSVEAIVAAAPIPLRKGGPSKRNAWRNWGLLAAAVAAIGLGIQFMIPMGPTPTAVHQVGGGGDETVTLNDGSFVRLAQGSTLREWEVEGGREVSLEGRAFFAVARDEASPFVVRTDGGEITVLGTRFQVDTEDDGISTVVVEGLVGVSTEFGAAEVPAGSLAHMAAGNAPFVQAVDDVAAYLNWADGNLLYQATPLSQVVEEVARFYGRTLSVQGSDLAQRRVTAWFQGEPFEAVAESLCVVTEAVCVPAAGGMAMVAEGASRNSGAGGTP